MHCPYCGEEMLPGYVQCRDGVYWSSKKRPVAALPIFGGDTLRLSDESTPFGGSLAAAYRCVKCRKIIIDYSEHET